MSKAAAAEEPQFPTSGVNPAVYAFIRSLPDLHGKVVVGAAPGLERRPVATRANASAHVLRRSAAGLGALFSAALLATRGRAVHAAHGSGRLRAVQLRRLAIRLA